MQNLDVVVHEGLDIACQPGVLVLELLKLAQTIFVLFLTFGIRFFRAKMFGIPNRLNYLSSKRHEFHEAASDPIVLQLQVALKRQDVLLDKVNVGQKNENLSDLHHVVGHQKCRVGFVLDYALDAAFQHGSEVLAATDVCIDGLKHPLQVLALDIGGTVQPVVEKALHCVVPKNLNQLGSIGFSEVSQKYFPVPRGIKVYLIAIGFRFCLVVPLNLVD